MRDILCAMGEPEDAFDWVRRLRDERSRELAPAFVELAARVGAVRILLPPSFGETDAAAAMRAAASL